MFGWEGGGKHYNTCLFNLLSSHNVLNSPQRFCSHEEADNAVKYISGTKLDDRIIRTDWDPGFIEGRQYGRGKSGGQVRDEYRTDYDEGRGGPGMGARMFRFSGGQFRRKEGPEAIEDTA